MFSFFMAPALITMINCHSFTKVSQQTDPILKSSGFDRSMLSVRTKKREAGEGLANGSSNNILFPDLVAKKPLKVTFPTVPTTWVLLALCKPRPPRSTRAALAPARVDVFNGLL